MHRTVVQQPEAAGPDSAAAAGFDPDALEELEVIINALLMEAINASGRATDPTKRAEAIRTGRAALRVVSRSIDALGSDERAEGWREETRALGEAFDEIAAWPASGTMVPSAP